MPLPTVPAGTVVAINANTYFNTQPQYPPGSGTRLSDIRGGIVDQFGAGDGVCYDTTHDLWLALCCGGDSDGGSNAAMHFDPVTTQSWSVALRDTVNLIPMIHGGAVPPGADGASVCQGTVGLVNTLAASAVNVDVALTDVSQFAATGGQAYLTANGDFTVDNRETLTYSSVNLGANTIHVTARGANARTLAAGSPMTPLAAGGGPLTRYTDTLGLYGPVNQVWPVSRHLYGGICWMPSVARAWMAGGSRWFEGADLGETFEYDPLAKSYTYQSADPIPGEFKGIISVWDRVKYRVLYLGFDGLYSYTPSAAAGSKYLRLTTYSASTNQTHGMLHDPRRKRVVFCGVNENAARGATGMSYTTASDLTGSEVWSARVDVPGNPMANLPMSVQPYFGYDPVADDYVYYCGGNTLYHLHPDTWALTSETLGGVTLTATPSNDVGFMMSYVESQNIWILPDLTSGFSITAGSVFAIRRLDQSNAIALPNRTMVQLPRWAQGQGPNGAPPPGGAGNDKLTQWTWDRVRKKILTVGGNIGSAYATPPFVGKSGNGSNEMWEGVPLGAAWSTSSMASAWTEVQSMTTTPGNADVVPDTPEDVAFAHDPFSDRAILAPGFFNSSQLASRTTLASPLNASDGPGAKIFVTAQYVQLDGVSLGGVQDLSGFPSAGTLYLYPVGGVAGQQEVIAYAAKTDVSGGEHSFTIQARAQNGTTAHTFPAGARCAKNGAYGSYNPTGPLADYGYFELNPTPVAGWARWARAAFPLPARGATDNASTAIFDTRPSGTRSFLRPLYDGQSWIQQLNRTTLPGTWVDHQLGTGAFSALGTAMPSATVPGPGQRILVGATSDRALWPPTGVVSIAPHIPVTFENILYTDPRPLDGGGDGSVLIVERGYRSTQPQGGQPSAHSLGEECRTPLAGLLGVVHGQDRLALDPAEGQLYFVAHLGGNFGYSFEAAPYLMRVDLSTWAASPVAPMPHTYLGDRTVSFVAEQYCFLDPLNRLIFVPDHVQQWNGQTIALFIYHLDLPTTTFNLTADPGWETFPLPTGQIIGNRGIWNDYANYLIWGVGNNGTDQGIENILRIAGGPSSAAPISTNPLPTITTLQPTTTTQGTAVVVAVAGTGFILTSVVHWDGAPQATTFINASTLQFTVTAGMATVGTHPVTVVNPTPGGGTSNALPFTVTVPANPIPVLTHLAPGTTTEGAQVSCIVDGINLLPSTVINWDGAPQATTPLSATQVQFLVPGGLATILGAHSVTATNPAPGGGVSNSLTFTVLPAPPPTAQTGIFVGSVM